MGPGLQRAAPSRVARLQQALLQRVDLPTQGLQRQLVETGSAGLYSHRSHHALQPAPRLHFDGFDVAAEEEEEAQQAERTRE